MSNDKISLDDLRSEYTDEDYKIQRREPKPGIVYEFEVIDAQVLQSNKGFLNMKLEVHALDSDGKQMFKKYINVPMPISLPDVQAPEYAKGLWITNVKPFFPEHAPYDKVEEDAITGKKVYSKGGEPIKGDAYDKAVFEANKAVAAKATDVAKIWVEKGDKSAVPDFAGKRFFAKVKVSKDGKYVNVDKMTSTVPEGEDVCYDRKAALGQ